VCTANTLMVSKVLWSNWNKSNWSAYLKWTNPETKLQNTRHDRSRGIRDEATACEPEVVLRERTWPLRPVALPSMPIARPVGTKRGPNGLLRGTADKTGIRNMTAPDFLTSYLTSNTLECLSRTVTEFYRVMTKSRPKYTITSGLTTTILSRIFRIKVNFTEFRTISGIFESTSGFRLQLPVYRFRFVA